MRFSPAFYGLAIGCYALFPQVVSAQDSSYESQRMQARHELEIALAEFRDYWQIEFPRIRRDLDARIDLTEAEIRIYRERLRLYDPFDRWSTGGALVLPLQDLRMCLREAEWRLRDLRAERNNLIRFRTPEWRHLEQRLHEARLRVAAIEAAEDRLAELAD